MRNAFFAIICLFMLLGCTSSPQNNSAPNISNQSIIANQSQNNEIKDLTLIPNETMVFVANISPSIPIQPASSSQSNNSGQEPTSNTTFSYINNSGWSTKNALKISMLKSGERLSFQKWQLSLSGFSQTGIPKANFEVLDSFGASLLHFDLENNHAVELVLPDRSKYIITSVFSIGEGSKSHVQVQVYESKDIQKSNMSIQIGEPQNGFTIEQMFPLPPKVKGEALALGGASDVGEFKVLLVGVDQSTKPVSAEYELEDSAGQPISRFILGLGQMVNLHMSDSTRYAIVFKSLASEPHLAAQTDIYRITLFLKNSTSKPA